MGENIHKKKHPVELQEKNDLTDFLIAESMMFIHASQFIAYVDSRSAFLPWDPADGEATIKAKMSVSALILNLKRLNQLRRKSNLHAFNFEKGLDQAQVVNKMILKLFTATEEQHALFDHASEMIMQKKIPMFLDWEYADLQEISKRSKYSVEAIRDIMTWLYKYGEEAVVKR